MTRTRSQNAMTIGTVLLMVTVGTLAVLTMVAASFFHLQFSTVVVNQRSARNMAESALATGLAELWSNPEYGQARSEAELIHLVSESGDGAEAWLTFNEAKASEFEVPYSTNNFESPDAVTGGNGRRVPDSAVHLVALGTCRGARHRAEVLYYIPPYPNALASTGPVVATGGLLVAGVMSTEEFVNSTSGGTIDPNQLEPAHIASNSRSPDAVDIGPNSEIYGDVMAMGGIKLASTVDVMGEVRPNSTEQPIPELDVDGVFGKLDNIATRVTMTETYVPSNLTIDYFTELTSDMVVGGDLVLDGGVVYSRKDLQINGEVRGHGAVFCKGDLDIRGGADISATDQIAVVAEGRVELEGDGDATNFLNGLVYSEDSISAKDITIVGAAVVNSDDKAELRLDNVNLVKSPLSVNLVFGVPSAQMNLPVTTTTTSKKKKGGFFESKRKYTTVKAVVGPDKEKVENALAAGVQLSGHRMPDKDGEARFSVLVEGLFGKVVGVNSLADLTADERLATQVDSYPHEFKDGNLYIRYERRDDLTASDAVTFVDDWKAQIKSAVGEPINYNVTTTVHKKKKKVFGLGKTKKSKKSTTEPAVFNPAAGIDSVDAADYLANLIKPTEEDGPYFVDLSLNRVFDPAQSSRILLWQSF